MTVVPGIRLVDLARELKMTPAELVTALKDLGVETSGPNTVLDPETANDVRSLLGKPAEADKVIEIGADATVKDIAQAMQVAPNEAQKKLLQMGELVAINQKLPHALAERLAAAYGYTLKLKAEPKPAPAPAAPKHKAPAGALQPRPPVVTVMGHVDHGKTTLLDTIRHTNVVAGEHGGITQHIGAYQVEVEHNGEKRKITFLDTPGHRAFTKMRARGASVTDIVVLVVAADDGIMPQTVEAINHTRAAGVPMIVAINKIDKPEANPDRIKQQLTEHNLVVEEYGGDVIAVPISAKTGQGIPDLLEYILLVADVEDLKADPHGHASGTILEASVEPGRGPVAKALVQSGTLRVGDSLVAGLAYGKVRAMTNERGERLQKAPPATPVEIIGFHNPPDAGDTFEVVKNEKEARQIAEKRQEKARAQRMSGPVRRLTLDDLSRQAREGAIKDLNVIVKADVQGSLEAVIGQLNELAENKSDDEVRLNIKHSAVGNISEADIDLAVATGSIVVGFNVRADSEAQRAAERDGVDVRLYNIIYDLVEDMDRAMKGLLTPVFEEVVLGRAVVRQNFRTPRGVMIAGCYVTEGKLQRGAEVRLRRGKDLLFTGRIESLRHLKDDVREIAQGFECGVVIQDWNEPYQVDDVLECFEMRQVNR
ncbi:MAG: translation initiation factor IF-2 [Chloroherpetonaceae bacterium]|nr:translation initiation factor IF-2 [Chthonomonadaceae bacterium]MDW8206323.1 translation initiation factor IF-2 [Chloroherpetonaceae bacterium]